MIVSREKKDASIDLSRGGNVFDYFRTFARIRKYEAQPPRRVPPPPPFHRWDKSMLHEFTADELARSFREITRYKPIPVDSPRFVNHRPSRFLPPPPSRRDAAAKFSSNKISGAIVPRNVVGGVAFLHKWISVESLICWERFNGILPGFGRESAKYRDVPKDVLHWQEVCRHLVRSPFLAGTLNLNLSIRIFQDTIRFWERFFKLFWSSSRPRIFERISNFSLFQKRLVFLSYCHILSYFVIFLLPKTATCQNKLCKNPASFSISFHLSSFTLFAISKLLNNN